MTSFGKSTRRHVRSGAAAPSGFPASTVRTSYNSAEREGLFWEPTWGVNEIFRAEKSSAKVRMTLCLIESCCQSIVSGYSLRPNVKTRVSRQLILWVNTRVNTRV